MNTYTHPPIVNGNERPANAIGYLPNMRDALANWLRPMVATPVTKVGPSPETGFLVVEENLAPIPFVGCMLPYPSRELKMFPEKQRAWKWWKMFTTSDLHLKDDDEAVIDNIKYRVMKNQDFLQAGYYQYSLVESYSAQ